MHRLPASAVLGLAAILGATAAYPQAPVPAWYVRELEDKLHTDSLDAELHYRLATQYLGLKRFDDAERELRMVTAIDSRYAPAWLSLSFLPYARRPKLRQEEVRGRVPLELISAVDEAHRLRRLAFLIDPLVDLRPIGEPREREGLVHVPRQVRTPVLLEVGLGAFQAARYELSYSSLQSYVERTNRGPRADSIPDYVRWYRGLAAAHTGRNTEAVKDFLALLRRAQAQEQADTVIRVQLRTNDFRYVLAILYERAGLVSAATNWYREALENDVGLYMGHVRLAQIHRRSQEWPLAVQAARSAVASNPDDPVTIIELATIYEESNRIAEAQESWQRAMDANPRDPRPPYRLGQLEQRIGDVPAARAAYQRFLAIAPSRYEREISEARWQLQRMH